MHLSLLNIFRNKMIWLMVAFALFGFFIQTLFLLNGDVGSLLFDTKLFLQGGTYVTDFFETNPPMIFIIYSPAVIFSDLTKCDIIICIRIYILLLAFISLMCCERLFNKIIDHSHTSLRYLLMTVLMFLFFIQPTVEFGQREHILIILIMPYLLTVIARIQNIPIPAYFSIFIGILAAFGFGLKPYFLFTLIFVEGYFMLQKRNIWGWVRVESVLCGTLLSAYLLFVYYYHPHYFDTMLPLLSHLYFVGIQQSWLMLLTHYSVMFCLIVLGYYIFFYKIQHFRVLTQVMLLSFIGMILAFIVSRAAWSYHVFPAVVFAVILLVIALYQAVYGAMHHKVIIKKDFLFFSGIVLMVPMLLMLLQIKFMFEPRYQESARWLKKTLQSTPSNSVYCFSSFTTGFCFPLVYTTNKQFGGRFPFFWWLRGLILLEENTSNEKLLTTIQKDKKYLIESIAHDLNQYQPHLILISEYDESRFVEHGFSYINYFSENSEFRSAWKHYSYLTGFNGIRIYQRLNDEDV